MMNRLAHMINGILLAGLVVGSIAVYDNLPAQIPVHMGLDGKVDGWEARTLLSWLSLPLVAAGMTVLLYIIARLMDRYPHLVNLPGRERFRELSPERRDAVMRVLRAGLYRTAAAQLAMFILIQMGIYQAATGDTAGGYLLAALLIGLAGIPCIALVLVIKVDATVRATRPARQNVEAGAGG